jgi:hypothetical protein
MRHGIINKDTKKVVNVVIWEGAEWLPPRNHWVVQNDTVDIGDTYDDANNVFIKPDLIAQDPN